MEKAEILRRAHRFCAPFRVDDGAGFRLADCDPGSTLDLDPSDRQAADAIIDNSEAPLSELANALQFMMTAWLRAHAAMKESRP